MQTSFPRPEKSAAPRPVPLAIERALRLVVVIAVVLGVGAVARGALLLSKGLDPLVLALIVPALVPPALAAFFARRVLRKAPTLAIVALGIRVGAIVSFTAVVASLYSTMLLHETAWAGVRADMSYLSMPLVTLVVGGISSICGAVTGGLIAKVKEHADAA